MTPERHPGATETACRRHAWVFADIERRDMACLACRVLRDPIRSRRGKSANRFGKDQERRIEKLYGPRKVGEFGDAIDLLGRDWKWQSKATRTAPPLWLVSVDAPQAHRPSQTVLGANAAMLALYPTLSPLVITSYVGRRTRDWIWVRAWEWSSMHGPGDPSAYPMAGWIVMSGIAFLTINGRDEP